MLVLDLMQEAVAVTTAIQEEIFLEMGIGNPSLLALLFFFSIRILCFSMKVYYWL